MEGEREIRPGPMAQADHTYQELLVEKALKLGGINVQSLVQMRGNMDVRWSQNMCPTYA